MQGPCVEVELVFPRSGQVLPVKVPVEIFELVVLVNKLLSSFVFCNSVPSSCFERLRRRYPFPA